MTTQAKSYPAIHTPPPGPKAQALIAEDKKYASNCYIKAYPLAVERGDGAMIEDVDGNRYLDFMSGIGVATTGHSHPKVVEAIQRAAAKFLHICGTDFFYASLTGVLRKLCEIAPGKSPKRAFLGNTGTEAVEAAIKLARYHTKRPQLIAFAGAFHGRTLGALSLTASKAKQRTGFGPLLPGVTHIPYAHCYRCPYNLTYPSCGLACLQVLEDEIFKRRVPAEEVAAIVVEPIQGEGGYVVPPPDYLSELKTICQKYGILCVADEVQSGIGRTGRWFASDHVGLEPDVVTTAKGLASGLPLGAIVARADVSTWSKGSHGSTFGGNPVACEAALATLELVEHELMGNAARLGHYLMIELHRIKQRRRLVGDVRGLGLMIGIELVRDRDTKERASNETQEVILRAFRKGLLLLDCGENVVRFSPPLTIDQEDADRALAIFDEVLAEVENERAL
ncbi:MAG: acetyl ornithine aminotransferase family protein [Deltaproteobacteria bacterium]|nr:acetyl ornithine aminotransferase family protein [Deltaproteobacteria bacterium]